MSVTVTARAMEFGRPTGKLRLQTIDKMSGRPVTVRLSLQQEGGKSFAPPGALHRVLDDYGHFYCDGENNLTVPAGEYHGLAW